MLVDQWRAAGLNANLHVSGSVRSLTPQTNLTLYRAAQEALTNVAKHANATLVDVRLNYGEDRIRLTIQDNGVGANNSEGGFGLFGIRERVQLLNGAVRVSTEAKKGFTLAVEVPE